MTPEQKQKLIDAYKEAESEQDSACRELGSQSDWIWISGKVEGMITLLEILGLIDNKGNLIE